MNKRMDKVKIRALDDTRWKMYEVAETESISEEKNTLDTFIIINMPYFYYRYSNYLVVPFIRFHSNNNPRYSNVIRELSYIFVHGDLTFTIIKVTEIEIILLLVLFI